MAERGKYKTRQQEVILGCLKKQKLRFLTADQFMESLEKDNITVGYTTVYRALERLEEEGKVIKLPTEDGTKTRYCFAEKEILEKTKNKKRIIVVNKIDLKTKLNKKLLDSYIEISVKENIGIDKIKDEIKRLFNIGEISTNDMTYLSNARSIALLKKSLNNINDAINEINNNNPIDIVELSLKESWNNLGEVIGETYTDELLDELFSRFCLGK